MKTNFCNLEVVYLFMVIVLFGAVVTSTAQSKKEKQVKHTNFYVSPTGNDSAQGTKEKPLASLNGARDAIRAYRKENGETGPITVIIGAGEYEMTQPLELFPEDGGTINSPITYKAETGTRPVFSGGKKITGFKVNDKGIWVAEIPESRYYGWRFDQLYVNGKRAVIARTPNNGFLNISGVKQHIWERGSGRVADRALQILSFDRENFAPLRETEAKELDNIRFRAYHKWDFTLRHIDKIDKDSATVYSSGKGMKPWNPLVKGTRIVFENFAAALDHAEEWYLDPEGTLFYVPGPGQTPENSEVIAPVLEHIIMMRGDAVANSFVEHIRFEGITFSHCHYRIPRSGSEPNQAAALLNAAVMLEGSRNITFSDIEISHTGQHALWFGKGCSKSLVEHCYLNDLGGGGIYLGDVSPQKGAAHTSHIRLHNNIIQTGGREFPSAVGVWMGHSSDNVISHNDIGNFYYSGISVGWIWGYDDSNAKRNTITYNNIHHIGWTLLSDMAAVYTLGKSEGTVISNNVVHHVHAYSYGGWGLYTDEGSSDIIMENNLVYNTKTGGFHQHYGKNNLIRNNIFAFAKLYQAQCTRVEDHRSFDFTNNIMVFDEGVVLKGAWEKINIRMDKNLYWNTNGGAYDFNGKTFNEWKKTGHDIHSIIADPYFMDSENYNFNFKSKKSIRRIGFKPFDYSAAGVYGVDSWIEKARLSEDIRKAFDKDVELNMNSQ